MNLKILLYGSMLKFLLFKLVICQSYLEKTCNRDSKVYECGPQDTSIVFSTPGTFEIVTECDEYRFCPEIQVSGSDTRVIIKNVAFSYSNVSNCLFCVKDKASITLENVQFESNGYWDYHGAVLLLESGSFGILRNVSFSNSTSSTNPNLNPNQVGNLGYTDKRYWDKHAKAYQSSSLIIDKIFSKQGSIWAFKESNITCKGCHLHDDSVFVLRDFSNLVWTDGTCISSMPCLSVIYKSTLTLADVSFSGSDVNNDDTAIVSYYHSIIHMKNVDLQAFPNVDAVIWLVGGVELWTDGLEISKFGNRALHLSDGCNVHLSRTKISDPLISQMTGTISVYGNSNLYLLNETIISGGKSNYAGGAITIYEGSSVSCSGGSQIVKSKAAVQGGAIFIEFGSSFIAKACSIMLNTAPSGSAIYAEGSKMIRFEQGSSVSNNFGGVAMVFALNSKVEISGEFHLSFNSGTDISLQDDATLTLESDANIKSMQNIQGFQNFLWIKGLRSNIFIKSDSPKQEIEKRGIYIENSNRASQLLPLLSTKFPKNLVYSSPYEVRPFVDKIQLLLTEEIPSIGVQVVDILGNSLNGDYFVDPPVIRAMWNNQFPDNESVPNTVHIIDQKPFLSNSLYFGNIGIPNSALSDYVVSFDGIGLEKTVQEARVLISFQKCDDSISKFHENRCLNVIKFTSAYRYAFGTISTIIAVFSGFLFVSKGISKYSLYRQVMCFGCILGFAGLGLIMATSSMSCVLMAWSLHLSFSLNIGGILAKSMIAITEIPDFDLIIHKSLPITILWFPTIVTTFVMISWSIVSPPQIQDYMMNFDTILVESCQDPMNIGKIMGIAKIIIATSVFLLTSWCSTKAANSTPLKALSFLSFNWIVGNLISGTILNVASGNETLILNVLSVWIPCFLTIMYESLFDASLDVVKDNSDTVKMKTDPTKPTRSSAKIEKSLIDFVSQGQTISVSHGTDSSNPKGFSQVSAFE